MEVKLGEICEITDGTHYSPKDAGVGYPFLTVKDMGPEGLDFANCIHISDTDFEYVISSNSCPTLGDVLFSKDGTVGKVHVVKETCEFGVLSSIAILRPDTRKVYPGYLGHALKSKSLLDAAIRNKTGSAIRRIILGDIKKLTIPLPNLNEQEQIAEVLDKADALRQKRRLALQKLDTLLQSVFLEMFGDPTSNPHGWEIARLGQICRLVSGNSLPTGDPFDNQQSGLLLLKVSDMNSPGNENFIGHSKLWARDYSNNNAICPKGSIIIPKRGGAIFTNKKRLLERSAVLDPNLMGIIPNSSQLNPCYLFQWFQGFDLGTITSGSSVPQLNKQDLAPLHIAVPPVELQMKFERTFMTVYKLVDVSQLALSRTNRLFESFQQLAFSGRLFESSMPSVGFAP